MTCTKPASSEPPSSIMIASSQSWKRHLAVEAPARRGPPLALLGAQRVAGGRLAGLEPHDRDELPVVGHAVGAAEPALRAGGELLPPPVHLLAQHRLVRAHPLDDLDEHLNPPISRAPSWRSGPPADASRRARGVTGPTGFWGHGVTDETPTRSASRRTVDVGLAPDRGRPREGSDMARALVVLDLCCGATPRRWRAQVQPPAWAR